MAKTSRWHELVSVEHFETDCLRCLCLISIRKWNAVTAHLHKFFECKLDVFVPEIIQDGCKNLVGALVNIKRLESVTVLYLLCNVCESHSLRQDNNPSCTDNALMV